MSGNIGITNVLVVIDPTEKEQYALKRALMMNELLKGGVKIHLFITVENEKLYDLMDADDVHCDSVWLESLTKPLTSKNIDHTAEVVWTGNWHSSILEASKRHNVDMIILSDYRDKRGFTDLSASKWALLRGSLCPILIVDPSSQMVRKTVLAAVNLQTNDPRHAALNKNILRIPGILANDYGAELHIVNGYDKSENFPDRAMLIRESGAKQENIHVEIGDPVDLIDGIAKKIDADVVVIGTIARKGVLAAMRGNKSEHIIHKMNRDVMVINSSAE